MGFVPVLDKALLRYLCRVTWGIIIIYVLHFWIGSWISMIMVMVSETASAYFVEQ